MNIGLIRGNLNRKADGNPELGKKFLSVETLYLISSLEDKEKVQTTNIILIMVAKAIVVRNLFSFEYDGSNPSLPTNDVSVRTNSTELIQNQSENKSG